MPTFDVVDVVRKAGFDRCGRDEVDDLTSRYNGIVRKGRSIVHYMNEICTSTNAVRLNGFLHHEGSPTKLPSKSCDLRQISILIYEASFDTRIMNIMMYKYEFILILVYKRQNRYFSFAMITMISNTPEQIMPKYLDTQHEISISDHFP